MKNFGYNQTVAHIITKKIAKKMAQIASNYLIISKLPALFVNI